jgi:hypothetical protein
MATPACDLNRDRAAAFVPGEDSLYLPDTQTSFLRNCWNLRPAISSVVAKIGERE